jgi:hypothetical protein
MAHVEAKQKIIVFVGVFVALLGYLGVVVYANDDPSAGPYLFGTTSPFLAKVTNKIIAPIIGINAIQ